MAVWRVLVTTQFYGRVYKRYRDKKKVYELNIFIHFIFILSYFYLNRLFLDFMT